MASNYLVIFGLHHHIVWQVYRALYGKNEDNLLTLLSTLYIVETLSNRHGTVSCFAIFNTRCPVTIVCFIAFQNGDFLGVHA